MASWLTHLRVAERIKQRISEIEFQYFLLGSIAPDSGIPWDERSISYNPSKEATHYKKKKADGSVEIDEALFFEKYLMPEKIMTRSDGTRSFLWGYYFHLITDKLWLEQIFLPYRDSFMRIEESSEEEFVKLIRTEMAALDFEYIKKNGIKLLDELRDSNANVGFFTELDSEYIYHCRKRIIEFYEGRTQLPDIVPKYSSSSVIDEFVINASDKCINILVV